MTYPKMKPCKCGNPDVAVYGYENGWKHVECDKCHYLGPGAGNIRQAIRDHNERTSTCQAQ
jgi:hypothetical protein